MVLSRIPSVLRAQVWQKFKIRIDDTYFCYCCEYNEITPFNFECGHVIARHKGGPDILNNLRPICRECHFSPLSSKLIEK